jgi:hypothetical protein
MIRELLFYPGISSAVFNYLSYAYRKTVPDKENKMGLSRILKIFFLKALRVLRLVMPSPRRCGIPRTDSFKRR